MALFAEYSPGIVIRIDAKGIIHMANPVARERLAPQVGAPLVSVLPGFTDVDLAACIDGDATLYHTEWLGECCWRFVVKGVRELGVAQIYGMDFTELETVRSALAARTADLERSNADLELFACAASHDIQEPLRTISGYLRLIQMRGGERLPHECVRYLDLSIEAAGRLQYLIKDLLAYAHVGSGESAVEDVDCGAAFDAACEHLRAAVEASDARVTRDSLPTVSGYPSELVFLFQNLLANAIRFRGDAVPRVHCAAALRDGWWELSVQDNGLGIEPRYLERIFGLFQRLHPRERAGSGVGLAVCRKIVERVGGRIWVESEPGRGSVFRFTLPQATGVTRPRFPAPWLR